MSSAVKEMHGTLDKSLYEMCEVKNLCDVTLVSDDGSTYAHKLVLMKVFPELKYLLCSLCHGEHEDITIILPGVVTDDIKDDLKNIYLFDDLGNLGNILGLNRDVNRTGRN